MPVFLRNNVLKMKKNLSIVLIMVLSCVFLTGFPVYAQDCAMTLRDCMEYAVENATDVRISKADRSDEQAQRHQAILAAFTPDVSANTNAYEQFGRNIDPETNTYTNVSSFHNSYSLQAGLMLFNGFKAVNNLKIANTSIKMGASKDEQMRDRICLATMEAFYNVIYYSGLADVLEEQVETARSAVRKAEIQEELGQKSHADVIQMASELAQKEYQLTSTRNLHSDALITLKDVMFWPVDQELVLVEEVNEPISSEISAVEIAAFAKDRQPSAAIARYALENADLELKSARLAYSPSLSLYGGWSTDYFTYPGKASETQPFRDQIRANGGEYVQLSLSIPIFGQGNRRSRIAQKKNAFERASAQYDQTMRDIENEVFRAVNDRDGAEAAFRQAERFAEVQEEAFSLNGRRFEQGLISSIEYHTASESYLNACAERLGSLCKYCIKDSIVKFYNGISYIEQF